MSTNGWMNNRYRLAFGLVLLAGVWYVEIFLDLSEDELKEEGAE